MSPTLSLPIVTLSHLQQEPQLAHVPPGCRLFLAIAARFKAMQDRSARKMVQAYKALIERLHMWKIFLRKQVLENEISQAYKDAITEHKIEYELVPPHDHRRNIAEKAIQTFKNHFVSILCGTDKDFPLYLWADLLS